MICPKKWFLLTIATLVFGSALNAPATLLQVLPAMGDLNRWAVFALGDGDFSNHLTDDAFVEGDVGIAGNGNLRLRGNSTIQGNLYYRSNGTLQLGNNATITAAQFNNQDAVLDNGVTEAINASNDAFALTPNRLGSSITLGGNNNTTITGAPGETVVLKLNYLEMSGNATLTLEGTATTTFIINVKNQFSLSGNSQITLSGGLEWDDVLFNVRGNGSDVCLTGNARLEGILMANRRTVILGAHATVRGAVIADRVRLNGNSRVIHPPVASP